MEGKPKESVLRRSVADSLLCCPVDCIEAHGIPSLEKPPIDFREHVFALDSAIRRLLDLDGDSR